MTIKNLLSACRRSLFAVFAGMTMPLVIASSPVNAQGLAPVKVTMIQHCCPGGTFFQPIQFGAEEAARIFEVDLKYVNAEGDAGRQANLIETAIAEGQDAVIVSITVPDALDEAVQKARDAGLYVISSNTDDPSGGDGNARNAYVGQNFWASGRVIGKAMVEHYGLTEGDHCLLPVEQPELVYAAQRGGGVQEALAAAGVTSEMIGTGNVSSEALTIVSQALIANPDIDCIIGLGSTPTGIMPQAAEEAGMPDLPNGGFDTTPAISQNIIDGLTLGTMDQQPFWQGFLPVMFAAYEARYGLAAADFDTGNNLITADTAQVALDHGGSYR